MHSFNPLPLPLRVLCAMVLIASSGAAFAQGKTVLRFADSLPANHVFTETVAKPWMAEVTRLTKGAVEFQHFPAEQLGKAADMLRLAQTGVADIAFVAVPYVSEKMPLSGVVELPGGFASSCAGARALWKLAQGGGLDKLEFQPNGVRMMFAIVQPPFQVFTSKKKVETVKDIEGLKLRTTGGAMDRMIRNMNGVPVRLSAPEVNESLSRGTIDGGVLAIVSVKAYSLTSMIRFATVGENFGSAALLYMISDAAWKKLTPAAQQAMQEAGRKVTFEGCAKIDEAAAKDVDQMRGAGITMSQFNPAERSKLNTILESVGAEWAQALDARGRPGTAVRKEFMDALRDGK